MKRLRILFILFFAFLSAYIYLEGRIVHDFCFAQESYGQGELITLYVGEIKIFPVDNVTRIAISKPEVADAQSVSKEEILIMAKGEGTTSLIWWDNLGQHALELRVLLEDLVPIKERIDNILKELRLTDVYSVTAESEGKVLLLGNVRAPEDIERVDLALGLLKDKTINLIKVEEEKASIEIEMQILELKKDATKELGFTPPYTTSLTEPSGKYGTDFKGIPEALFHLTDWTRQTFTATLDFLVKEGKARILSRPRLVCQSGKEAEFLVGGEKPILTTQSISGGGSSTEVEYKEYGIRLKIRPRLVQENKIQAGIEVEVSEIGDAEILGLSTAPTAKAYPLTKRSTSTELLMSNGQTLAISGLIKQKTEEELRKFPWLADIPILGIFFRGREVKVGGGRGELGDSELVITLTPTLLQEEGILPGQKIERRQELDKGLAEAEKAYVKAEESGVSGYTIKVMKRIRDNFIYPLEAYKNGLEGLVGLSLRLSSTGELLEVIITQPSGWSILDENAVMIIKRISPFPPFPPDINEKELWLNIPIAYNIEEK